MGQEHATSRYLNSKPRRLNEAKIIAAHNRLNEVLIQVTMACNSTDRDKMLREISTAEEYLRMARDLANGIEPEETN